MVKSCKRGTKKAVGDNRLTHFELYTCFLEIANLINQRPIFVLMTFCLDLHPLKYLKDHSERLETHERE